MVKKQYKIRYITDVKMVCMLLVFLWHCMLFYEDNPYFEESFGVISSSATFIGNMFDVILIAGFVFCSGYLYALSVDNHKRTMLQRVWERTKRLLIPYYIVGSLWLVPLYTLFDVKAFGRPDGAGWAEGYKCMLLGQFSDHLWFLWMLFWVALFFVLLTPLIKSNRMILLCVITVAAALCVDLFLADFPYFKLSQIGPYLICYYLGILFFKYTLKLEALPQAVKIAAAVVMLGLVIAYAVILPGHFAWKYLFKSAGALFMCFLFMMVSNGRIWLKFCDTKFYDYFNRHQMNAYLIHMPLPYLFVRFLRPYLGSYPWPCILLNYILVVLCVLCLVWIIEWMINRFMSLVRRLYGYEND